jgi:zinc transporter ZupT
MFWFLSSLSSSSSAINAFLSVTVVSVLPNLLLYLIPESVLVPQQDEKYRKKKRINWTNIMLCFAAGGLLGDVFLHILPHMLGSGHSHGHSQTAVGHSHEHSADHNYLQSAILMGKTGEGKSHHWEGISLQHQHEHNHEGEHDEHTHNSPSSVEKHDHHHNEHEEEEDHDHDHQHQEHHNHQQHLKTIKHDHDHHKNRAGREEHSRHSHEHNDHHHNHLEDKKHDHNHNHEHEDIDHQEHNRHNYDHGLKKQQRNPQHDSHDRHNHKHDEHRRLSSAATEQEKSKEHEGKSRWTGFHLDKNTLLQLMILLGFFIFLVAEKVANRCLTHDHSSSHSSHDNDKDHDKEKHDHGKSPGNKSTDSSNKEEEKKQQQQKNRTTNGKSKEEIVSFFQRVSAAGYLNLLADSMHNLTDGIALGAAFASSGGHAVGMATFISVVLHEIPHEVGDLSMLVQSGLR